MRWMTMAMMAAAVTAAACGSGSTAPTVCSSDSAWSGGNEESPLMNPGQDCIECHTREGEGPKFQIAGTVMGATNDDDNCNGLSGVTVELTGSDGQVHTFKTNAAGNFFSDEKGAAVVAMPYTARVISASGAVATMGAAQSSGSCNSCHTATGANGAPGRITVAK
jgi:mono/diheme cytochrome c family protein